MKPNSKRLFNKIVAVVTLFCMASQTTFAALLNLSTGPLFVGATVPPMVMLNVPKDHQMFTKLYNDYSDVNGDGMIDRTYTHSIDYYGYFDHTKCYVYTGGRFEPSEVSPTKYCTNKWSGNFLNWASMSRLDAVRKLLYGGFRTEDAANITVLERATITSDGHAWAKYYNGADAGQLVPFTVSNAQQTATSTSAVRIYKNPVLSVSSIVRAACGGPPCVATATVTTATPHGLANGDAVTIAGATGPTNFAAYNITARVENVTGTTFEYRILTNGSNEPLAASAVTGTLVAYPGQAPVALVAGAIDRSGTTATVTSNAHGLENGMTVSIIGATNSNNIRYNRTAVISGVAANTFQYTVSTSAPSPADPSTQALAWVPMPRWRMTQPAAGRTFHKGDLIRAQIDANNYVEGAITFISSTANSANVVFEIASPSTPNALHEIGVPVAAPLYVDLGSAAAPWALTDRSSAGITICNTTNPTPATFVSHTNISTAAYPPTTAHPPIIRVAAGDYSLWAVSDGQMCRWGGPANGNDFPKSELNASRDSPLTAVGLTVGGNGPDFNVRVKVCDPTLLGNEKCRLYESGNWKPIGLLQQYSSGDSKLIQFGLMTPSYSKNQSGGVLRKHVTFLDARPGVGAAGHNPYTAADPDELDPVTGIFRNTHGIIKTLNSIQMFGYQFNTNPLASPPPKFDQDSDGCGNPGVVFPGNDKCTSWGNPTSEMYIETLRYLAGKTVDSAMTPSAPAADAYSNGGLTKDGNLGLSVRGWSAPVTSSNYCAPLNVIVMNASVSSYDNDNINDDIFAPLAAPAPPPPVGTPTTAKGWTKKLGDDEGFTIAKPAVAGPPAVPAVVGTKIMIGTTSAAIPGQLDVTAVSGLGMCTPKEMDGTNGLGDVAGICPEAPMLSGSFLLSGAAYWARQNRIMPGLTKVNGDPIPAEDKSSLRVNTYGISLSGASPRIKLAVPGSTGTVAILPAGRTIHNDSPTPKYRGTGSIVDFKVVRQDAVSGKFFVSWEDSLQGNDYDLDSWGVISYQFGNGDGAAFVPCDPLAACTATTIRVTTDVVYGQAGFSLGFGYVISGVTAGKVNDGSADPLVLNAGAATYGDGVHYTSAHRGQNPQVSNTTDTNSASQPFYWPPADGALGTKGTECNKCQQMDGPRWITFSIAAGGTGNILLEDPLYYAAKYGNYKDLNKDDVRDTGEWDQKIAGQPDAFFLVTDPNKLEDALEASFVSILSRATASSVATNSTSLQTTSKIYQAKFNPADWSGQVLAYAVLDNGSISATEDWDAGTWLKNASSVPPPGLKPTLNWDTGRQIITIDNQPGVRTGIPFRTAGAPPELIANLNTDPVTGGSDGRAQDRLDYLRGKDTGGSLEGATPTAFRSRPVTKLGDIVNSSPNFVAAPNAGFADSSYVSFRNTYVNRTPMIYVGGNDGMLHGFSADETGKELLAFVPSKTFPHLNKLTNKAYTHRYYVDGSPEIGDGEFDVGGSTAWRTVLVGTLGAGGQGLFALDITNPTNFSEGNAASIVLWEFNDKDDPNLGYVMGQPVIRKMHSTTHPKGRWAVIVPGGYNNSEGTPLAVPGETLCTASVPVADPAGCTTSTTGRAYLYIIYLDGPKGGGKTWQLGTDYLRLDTEVGTTTTPNGLGSPLAADVDADGRVDYIYAGDLQGNLFKWNVTNPDHSEWVKSDNRVILYTATTGGGSPQAQPITSKVEGTLHPGGTGFIITFGTGKYLEPSDPSAPYAKQTFYGIWDMNNGATTATQTTVASRDQLLKQEITLAEDTNFRIVTENVPQWSQDLTAPLASDTNGSPPNNKHLGWYLDFPDSETTGERAVFRPILTAGRLIFTTLTPNDQACESGGSSFLMIIDPTTGGRINAAVLNVKNDGELNALDKVESGAGLVFASGVQSAIGITPTPTIVKVETKVTPPEGGGPGCAILGTCAATVAGSGFQLAFALAAGSSGGNASTMIGLGASGGRVSWRELMAQ